MPNDTDYGLLSFRLGRSNKSFGTVFVFCSFFLETLKICSDIRYATQLRGHERNQQTNR